MDILDWIMDGPAWVRYRCLVDLTGAALDDPRVGEAYYEMALDSGIRQLISDVCNWGETPLKRHNDASHSLHKLAFLAEIGMTVDTPEIRQIADMVIRQPDEAGILQVLSNYPTVFGGSGQDEWLWALCDTPLVAASLVKMKAVESREVERAYQPLIGLVKDNGWPCAASPNLPRFRGPGRREDACPYATLLMVRLLTELDESEHSAALFSAADALLTLWENSRNQRPFLFRMGTDFRKLKVPFIWYDILNLADALSLIPAALADIRFGEILDIIQCKADMHSRFTSESIWTRWKGWEFCQKKEPSRWVTLCALRVLKRAGRWPAKADRA